MVSHKRFPTGGQYQEAVQHAERYFSDPELRSASFERMAMGLPKMISGNFASVFPMTAKSGRSYAVKCFTREVPHQLQRYQIIGEQLTQRGPWWATDFQFLKDGVRVENEWYPILRMNWVSGRTLVPWITDHIIDPRALAGLAEKFDQLVADLADAGMAHGDLQEGNLLVTESGKLHLVDYDGMYVPGLAGLPAGEVGHPDYQPQNRSQADYGPAMDRFSAWLISLSLRILVVAPELWDQLNPGRDDYLLLNRNDLANLSSSPRFSTLISHQNAEVRRLARLAGDILPLPLAAIPELAVPSVVRVPPPVPGAIPRAGPIPDWMKGRITEQPGSPLQGGAAPYATEGEQLDVVPARPVVWLVRAVILVPLLALAGTFLGWQFGLLVLILTSSLAAIFLWVVYRRDSLTRAHLELRKSRRAAALDVTRAAKKITHAEKEAAKVERAVQAISSQQTKKRTAVQANFSRRQQAASKRVDPIDRQLAQLASSRQKEMNRRLQQLRANHVNAHLSRALLDGSQISGVGAQLAGKLRACGIRSAADFSGISYMTNGGSTIVYFRRTSGGRVHVPGIGEVKARRIEQWRQVRLSQAVATQPIALTAAEQQTIDSQFANQARHLEEERAHIGQLIAVEINTIQQELNAALSDVDKHYETERAAAARGKMDSENHLRRAHGDHLSAQQELLAWNDQLNRMQKHSFSRFVKVAVRG
jgi:hypothetical protein